MSKDAKVRILAVIVGIIIWGGGFLYFTSPSLKHAINKGVSKDSVNQEYKIVSVPKSKYVLVITNDPHNIWVYKHTELLNRNYVSLQGAMSLYTSASKKVDYFFGKDTLLFGVREVKGNDTLTLPEAKINLFPIGSYFKNSKFAFLYKDLVFYSLDTPTKIKREFLEPVFTEDYEVLEE